MTNGDSKKNGPERLVNAYRRMLERINSTARDEALPAVRRQIDRAKETAVELGELTAEEAERIGGYLRRDVEDAAAYLTKTGHEFRDWYRFDLKLVEERLAEMFAAMVDRTRAEVDRIADRARGIEKLHTGEITGAGTLYCADCGRELHFHKPGHIPPCPNCRGTHFRRFNETGEDAD